MVVFHGISWDFMGFYGGFSWDLVFWDLVFWVFSWLESGENPLTMNRYEKSRESVIAGFVALTSDSVTAELLLVRLTVLGWIKMRLLLGIAKQLLYHDTISKIDVLFQHTGITLVFVRVVLYCFFPLR